MSWAGVVGADGNAASTTGELCIDHAGDIVGDGFAVQANMMSSPDVWTAMASTFASSSVPLARRLLATLMAGEEAGGDARGRMSAALIVVEAVEASQPGAGTVVDLRVDRSDDPLGDLAKLLDAADAFAGFNRAVDQLIGGDRATALSTFDGALRLLPGEENLRFVRSGALGASGPANAAIAEMRSLVESRPSWEIVVRSFASKGLMALPPDVSIDTVFGKSDRGAETAGLPARHARRRNAPALLPAVPDMRPRHIGRHYRMPLIVDVAAPLRAVGLR